MHRKPLYQLVLSSMFFAIGLVLPFFTGQIPEIGNMLLPMHIPVLLCGLVVGWQYGAAVGALLPIVRSLIFGMPLMFPSAVAMAFELSVYGCFVGLLFGLLPKKNLATLYLSLISAMLLGRAVWGCVMTLLLSVGGSGFAFSAFLSGAFLSAIPGIVLQLVLIPSVMLVLDRTRLCPWRTQKKTPSDTEG